MCVGESVLLGKTWGAVCEDNLYMCRDDTGLVYMSDRP